MKGFDPKYKDLPDYILKITREIWEERGIATLNHYYTPDIPMRFPEEGGIPSGGVSFWNFCPLTHNETSKVQNHPYFEYYFLMCYYLWSARPQHQVKLYIIP